MRRRAKLLRRLSTNCAPACDAERERSEEHTSELQSQSNLVCRLLLEKKKTGLNVVVPLFLKSVDQVEDASDPLCIGLLPHQRLGCVQLAAHDGLCRSLVCAFLPDAEQ